ncbi:hypothetical protein COB57_05620 [Candidatus Peregrinibacteria bacterium]|nr:MAG: hypothetical protein COB57_05620 [Candidatus Peregrinibacteria bacterium]
MIIHSPAFLKDSRGSVFIREDNLTALPLSALKQHIDSIDSDLIKGFKQKYAFNNVSENIENNEYEIISESSEMTNIEKDGKRDLPSITIAKERFSKMIENKEIFDLKIKVREMQDHEKEAFLSFSFNVEKIYMIFHQEVLNWFNDIRSNKASPEKSVQFMSLQIHNQYSSSGKNSVVDVPILRINKYPFNSIEILDSLFYLEMHKKIKIISISSHFTRVTYKLEDLSSDVANTPCPIILGKNTGIITLHDVEQGEVAINSQLYKYLEVLINNYPNFVSHTKISEYILSNKMSKESSNNDFCAGLKKRIRSVNKNIVKYLGAGGDGSTKILKIPKHKKILSI